MVRRHGKGFGEGLFTAVACLALIGGVAGAASAQPPATGTTAASDDDQIGNAKRGLIAPFRGEIRDDKGQIIWNLRSYDFLDSPAAAGTINPSLLRHARLNMQAGLFRVADGVYQLRGFDLANMTVIEGSEGLIVVDPLTTIETARAALEFYYGHRPRRPVRAVIYTHSHPDHFGGTGGVADEANVRAGKVDVYAPKGFLGETASETVFAGTAMYRRAQYQGGMTIEPGPRSQVDAGLGKGGPRGGTARLIAPTIEISQPYETRRIAGVEIEFQLTPGTEAPAEMNFYLPAARALGMAENVVQTMHNVLTPRGAQVRDAKAWGRFIDASLVRYGDRSDVLFAQHNWPTWGKDAIGTLLADQRDMYSYTHDRALHLLNQGLLPDEIAEKMRVLPGALAQKWSTRGYYGSLSFNARAIYQRYLGFYDGNPAHLDPLPPVEKAKRFVAALGGPERGLEMLAAANAAKDYRWAVELGNQLVFADPGNAKAKAMQADALEQLGFATENALWRNMYLTGAKELRTGRPAGSGRGIGGQVRALTPEMLFDLMAIRLDSEKALGHDMTLNWVLSDRDTAFAMTIRNGVLTYRPGMRHPKPDAEIVLGSDRLAAVSQGQVALADAVGRGEAQVSGSGDKAAALIAMLTTFDPSFDIVTP